MRPKNIADWAEVISAVAVVISLFYLAFSVQQNTEAVRATVLNNVSSDALNMMKEGARKDIAIVTVKAQKDEALSEIEKEQYFYWLMHNLAYTESAWLHRGKSRIDGGYYETMVPFFCKVANNKVGRKIWFEWKEGITEDFWLETTAKCDLSKDELPET